MIRPGGDILPFSTTLPQESRSTNAGDFRGGDFEKFKQV